MCENWFGEFGVGNWGGARVFEENCVARRIGEGVCVRSVFLGGDLGRLGRDLGAIIVDWHNTGDAYFPSESFLSGNPSG